MKALELKEKLLAEGCNPSNFAILGRGDDAFCLDKKVRNGPFSILREVVILSLSSHQKTKKKLADIFSTMC